jgi:hypothetical protein
MYVQTMPFRSRQGYAVMRICSLNVLPALVRHIYASAVQVKFPAVVQAAQSILLVPAEKERRAAVGTYVIDQADSSFGIPQREQVFTKQPHAQTVSRLSAANRLIAGRESSIAASGCPSRVPGPMRVRSSFSAWVMISS